MNVKPLHRGAVPLQRGVSKRLHSFYVNSSQDNKVNGHIWYLEAHKFAKQLSIEHNLSLDCVAGVIAVLSPACTWEQNKKDAEKVIQAYSLLKTQGVKQVSVSTYAQNKLKALELIKDNKGLEATKTNLKTFNFSKNIINPLDDEHVTVDRHAVKALRGMKQGGSVNITAKEYKRAETAYKKTAKYLGILPAELQAVVWLAYKDEMGR